MKAERNSNIEILRIIVMFMIIAGHLTVQSGILDLNIANQKIAVIIGSGYGIADNIFILISAYFLVGKKFEAKRVLKIYFEVFIYVIPLLIITFLLGRQYVDIKEFVRCLFPYSGSPLWFATVYISLLLFSPFLNKIIENKEYLKKILVLLFFINVIPSTFLLRNDFFYSGEILYFSFLYLLVGYFRNYGKSIKLLNLNKYIYLLVSVLIYTCLIVFFFVIKYNLSNISFIRNLDNSINLSSYFISRYHTLPALICSISLMLFFTKLKNYSNKYINFASMGVFATYIIHQTPAFAKFMWYEIFKVQLWQTSNYYLVFYIFTVLIILFSGMIIGIIYKTKIEKYISNLKIYKVFEQKLNKFYKIKE